MEKFKTRQLAQMHRGINDFREGVLSLHTLLPRLEGTARAVGQEFWEQNVFDSALIIEQINADLVEERRALTPVEREQIESLLGQIERRLQQIE